MTTTTAAAAAANLQKRPEKIPRVASSRGAQKPRNQQQQQQQQQQVVFEERIFREVAHDNENPKSKGRGTCNNNYTDARSVALPIAVRSCWPKLFPTMSSAKKSVRKGIFFIRNNTTISSSNNTINNINNNVEEKNPSNRGSDNTGQLRKGKCGTMVCVEDVILRKLSNTSVGGRQQQSLFRIRGQSTNEIVELAIGGKLKIAYLDRFLAVVVKPHGMPMHKVPACQDDNGGGGTATVESDVETEQQTNDAKGRQSSRIVNSRVVSMHELLLHCMPPLKPQEQPLLGDQNSDDGYPLRRPAAVHRLDRPTYGLLIVARTRPSARFLSRAFEERSDTLVKRYRAIVHGHLRGSTIPKDRDSSGDSASTSGTFVRVPLSGKACSSEYFVVKKLVVAVPKQKRAPSSSSEDSGGFPSPLPVASGETTTATATTPLFLTLVDLVLHTGRKHQLRRHMASLGHPIVGDKRYGRGSNSSSKGINENDDDDEKLSTALSEMKASLDSSDDDSTLPPPSSNNYSQQPLPLLPLMLAAVNVTFPHPLGPTGGSSGSGDHPGIDIVDNDWKYCAMAKDSKHSFDASRGTLNVTIDLPESMKNILRKCSVV